MIFGAQNGRGARASLQRGDFRRTATAVNNRVAPDVQRISRSPLDAHHVPANRTRVALLKAIRRLLKVDTCWRTALHQHFRLFIVFSAGRAAAACLHGRDQHVLDCPTSLKSKGRCYGCAVRSKVQCQQKHAKNRTLEPTGLSVLFACFCGVRIPAARLFPDVQCFSGLPRSCASGAARKVPLRWLNPIRRCIHRLPTPAQ